MKEDSKDDNDIVLTSRDDVRTINLSLTQQTSRNINIMSKNLDAGIFDNQEFIEATKQLSISSKFSRIRILIKDSDSMCQNGHRMIKLIQQLTSSIEVRKVAKEYSSDSREFSLFDRKGVIYRPHAERYDGVAHFNRPRLVSELLNYFNEVWEHSIPDENLRRVYL